MGSDNSGAGKVAKRSKVTRLNIVADFETTTKREDCRVWLWGACDVFEDENIDWGIDFESFVDYITQWNANVYFHNLKFDGGFIIYWLLTNGFIHVDGDDAGIAGTFKSLISDMGQFYSVTVYWENGNTTEFRDSLKKLPMPVKRIASAFNLEEGKGDLDYELERPIGWKPTPEELDYLRRDVKIVAQAMRQILNSGMTRLTVASDSLAEYKRIVTSKGFSRMFPTLSFEMDAEIRRAYRGGFTYADPRFSGKINRSGHVLDVNSLYPSVMRYRPLPHGTPTFSKGRVLPTESRPLTIFSVTFIAKLKPNHIPCIQIKGSSAFQPTEYLTDIPNPTTLMMTNIDFDLYNDHYDMTVLEWGGGWAFHATEGLFDEYIDKWAKVKEESKGGIREIAKLHLNSLYGKFASNPSVTSKYPELREGVVRYVRGVDELRAPVYTAAGVFITSCARDLTIRAAQANYDTFAYADTDSLHLLRDDVPDNIDIHPTKMGAWKFEYAFDASFYIRPKAYLERLAPHELKRIDTENPSRYINRIAGLPETVSGPLTFDDLYEGHILQGKLQPVSVPGGIVLENIPFELKLSSHVCYGSYVGKTATKNSTKENEMSKTATAPAFVIGDYVPATAPNEYDPAVDALIEAGEGKSLTITAPLGVTRKIDENTGEPFPGNGSRDRLLFQKSANDKGYTARVVGEKDNGDGTVSFTFVLTAKNARAGRPRDKGTVEEQLIESGDIVIL